jgi:hypothetical protein
VTRRQEPPTARVAFEISAELRQRAEDLIEGLRQARDPLRLEAELIELVLALTDRGLHYFFLHPLQEAGVGLLTRRAVDLAIGTAGRALPMVVRRTIHSLDKEQLLTIAEFIDHIVIRDDE